VVENLDEGIGDDHRGDRAAHRGDQPSAIGETPDKRLRAPSPNDPSRMVNSYAVIHNTRSSVAGILPYAVTIFTGAFLLFQVQPLIAKYILPWFGGGPTVWTTCILFFQVLLLGGYSYAHLSVQRFGPRVQILLHGALLLAALLQLPIIPDGDWKPLSSTEPTWHIMLLLGVTIGLPYLVLSSTTPLMQSWFSQAHPGVSPYRLYALSNTGSLLALLSYPFVFEPMLSRDAQATFWAIGFGIFAVASIICVHAAWRRSTTEPETRINTSQPEMAIQRPTLGTRTLWLALPACAAVLLLAVTNQITMDFVVVPFLWVLPLSLYLVTFILGFENERWYSRLVFGTALLPALITALLILLGQEIKGQRQHPEKGDYDEIHGDLIGHSQKHYGGTGRQHQPEGACPESGALDGLLGLGCADTGFGFRGAPSPHRVDADEGNGSEDPKAHGPERGLSTSREHGLEYKRIAQEGQ